MRRLPLVVGLKTSATRVVVQIAGTAFRLSAANMVRVLRKCSQLEKMLNRYSQELTMQAMQVLQESERARPPRSSQALSTLL